MLGMAAAMGLFAPLSARLVRRHGVRLVCAAGLGVLAATYASMATVDHTTPIAVPAVLLVLLGIGLANVFAPPLRRSWPHCHADARAPARR